MIIFYVVRKGTGAIRFHSPAATETPRSLSLSLALAAPENVCARHNNVSTICIHI